MGDFLQLTAGPWTMYQVPVALLLAGPDILAQYVARTKDWAEHLRVRQDVNLRLMGLVEEMGLQIAFPTRTVHLVGGAEADGVGRDPQ